MKAITEHLFQIPLGAVNCFVIDAGKDGLILVDTGYEGSAEKIFDAIEKTGRSRKDIRNILLTHTHPDHAGSVAEIQQQTGATIIAHPADAALAAQGIAGRLPHIVSPGLINKIVFNLLIKKAPNKIPRFDTGKLVEDGEVLSYLGGLKIIHTPGHSAGHIAIHLLPDDVLIAGDICANMMGVALSTVYEDPKVGVQSVSKATQQPFARAVFGHGKPIMKEASDKMRKAFLKNKDSS